MTGEPYPAPLRGLAEALVYLIRARLGVPETIAGGLMEEALYDVRMELGMLEDSSAGLIRRPYTGLTVEADLLYKLARALRYRMERAGTTRITGVDYFVGRLDSFTGRVQRAYGIWALPTL
ncbi:MAG: hypothetical protein LRS48_00255 [Desulfurococcales archaeon]|nr:hypothetical protein [Desulfurococcales archaeon]